MSHGGEFWQNVVHWRREWQTTSVFLSWEIHEQYEYVYTHITQLAEITLPYSKILLAFKSNFSIVVVQLNCVWFFVTPWTALRQASLAFTIYQSLFKLMSIESVILFNHLILYFPLLLLPSIFPSISLFQQAGSSYQVAKVLQPQLQYQSF